MTSSKKLSCWCSNTWKHETINWFKVKNKHVLILYLPVITNTKWAASWQNQHNEFATSRLIRIHAVRLPTLLQVEKLIANSMDPDQTARMRRLVWIHTGRKPIMLVLSWRSSNVIHWQWQNIYYWIILGEISIENKTSEKVTSKKCVS
jgi:hypothetical protein